MGDHSAIRGPKDATSGLRVQAYNVGQLKHLLGGWAYDNFCLYSDFFIFFLFNCFRCSMLNPLLSQNTSVECVRLCAQEHTPFNIVPACLPSVPLLSRQNLSLFITVLFLLLLQCLNVRVSFLSIGIVRCKCLKSERGAGDLVDALKSPRKEKKRRRGKGTFLFSDLQTVFLTPGASWLKRERAHKYYPTLVCV